MPEKDEFIPGYKYPFNSCEILCSDNGFNISKLLRLPLKKILQQNDAQKNDGTKKDIEEIKNTQEENINNELDNKDNKKEDKPEKPIDNKDINNEKVSDVKDNENNNNNSNIISKEEDKKTEKDIIENNINKEEKKEKQGDNNDDNNKNEEKEEILDNFVSSINDIEEEKELEKEDEENIIDEEKNKQIIYDELLQYLFNFLDKETSFHNHVLSGYFNKIINFLLKKNTKLILDYIVQNNEKLLNKLLERIDQASIGNIIENILNALSECIISDSDKYFNYIIDYIINFISRKESNDEIVELVCQLIINSIVYNNKKKFVSFLESSIFDKIKDSTKILYENKDKNEKKIIYVIELVTKINNNILINLENRITPRLDFDAVKVEIINLIKINDRNSYQYYNNTNSKTGGDIIFNAYKSCLQKYCISLNEICITIINDIISDCNISKDSKNFGINNIYKFEFMCSVIDLYINNLQYDVDKRTFTNEKINDLIKTNIFNKIVNFYFVYKNNNFYANIFYQIIQIITNEKTPKELIDNILLIEENNPEKNLINLLINDLINDLKYIYEESKNEMYSLAFSHDVSILNSIFSSSNIYIKEIIEKYPKGNFFYEMFIDNIMKQFNKKLYKINDNIEKNKPDLFNPYFDAQKEQSDTDIPFSLQSLNEIVSLYLLVYEKYNRNEDYNAILKENEELLEVSIIYIISLFKYLNYRKEEKNKNIKSNWKKKKKKMKKK